MADFLAALGLVAVIEGVLYAVAPTAMKTAVRQILDVPESKLRIGGVVAMAVGVGLVWLART